MKFIDIFRTHIHTNSLRTALVNPQLPAALLFLCRSSFWSSFCSTRGQQDKSMIDSDEPRNNLAHWFQYEKVISFIPQCHMSRTLHTMRISACGPPSESHIEIHVHGQTQAHLSCFCHRPVIFSCSHIYFLIAPNLRGPFCLFLVIPVEIEIWQIGSLEFDLDRGTFLVCKKQTASNFNRIMCICV